MKANPLSWTRHSEYPLISKRYEDFKVAKKGYVPRYPRKKRNIAKKKGRTLPCDFFDWVKYYLHMPLIIFMCFIIYIYKINLISGLLAECPRLLYPFTFPYGLGLLDLVFPPFLGQLQLLCGWHPSRHKKCPGEWRRGKHNRRRSGRHGLVDALGAVEGGRASGPLGSGTPRSARCGTY